MSLGPAAGGVKITVGGVPSDSAAELYEKAIMRSIATVELFLQNKKEDLPDATGTLRSRYHIKKNLYGAVKTISLSIDAPYAKYVLQFGRGYGKRPKWSAIRTWAIAKGINLRKARAWWYQHSYKPKVYKSPTGKSLRLWWNNTIMQFRVLFETELARNLAAVGFHPNQFDITFEVGRA